MKTIALIQLVFVALVTAWICLRHSVHLRQRPEERRVLLAWHIIAVTASYFALTVIAASVELAGWLLPVAIFGFLTGDAAFVIMLTRLIPEWRTTSMLSYFKNSEKRSRIVVWILLAGMVIGISLIVWGVFNLIATQDDLVLALAAAETARKEDSKKLHGADKKLLEHAETSKERWEALAESNPQIAVPEVIESPSPAPSGPRPKRSTLIVVKPKATPTPSPSPTLTPTPKVKTRTIIRYRKSPTPKPFFQWFKSTR